MKIYKTQEEVDADLVDGSLTVKDDVTFTCNIKVSGNIDALNIDAHDIHALNIYALNIDALNIYAHDIHALNIYALNIYAHDIYALNIKVSGDIDALNIKVSGDIDALNIYAHDILYYAVCIAYCNFKCRSIKGRRGNCKHICLDTDIVITGR